MILIALDGLGCATTLADLQEMMASDSEVVRAAVVGVESADPLIALRARP